VSTATCSEPLIPTLDSLGEDLLATSSRQRWLALARPLIGVATYGLAAYARLWWLTPFLVFLIATTCRSFPAGSPARSDGPASGPGVCRNSSFSHQRGPRRSPVARAGVIGIRHLAPGEIRAPHDRSYSISQSAIGRAF
jgi:hypothetical protein